MKKIKSDEIAICPACKIKTPRVFLGGAQAICINSKCTITKFTVQKFKRNKIKQDGKKEKESKKNKSYNNSGKR